MFLVLVMSERCCDQGEDEERDDVVEEIRCHGFADADEYGARCDAHTYGAEEVIVSTIDFHLQACT